MIENKFKKEQVIGIWTLVSYEVVDNMGNKTYPMGEDATGFIMYHPEGFMSAQMMTKGRPKYASGALHTGTQEEMATAAQGYLAYAGPYKVDEVNKVVTHQMTVSMNPTWLGDSQPRYVNLDGDILEIVSPPIIEDGKEQNTKLIWKRVAA
ncbi:lipocalin-like domain-containing protein [Metabacillus litoralis]|uniref:Lipocalin-like domain-containing protein n=2 Tax=Metabacillus TaxID=2675233 RepID=A0ABS7UVM9_9BACI|nr:lipocalin-like domain-containing protein [Metabacillus rhizolycopersici]MBZ5752360.1 lipocalin-like domain-containing protein [Metabacillus rhizolycopersici]MCM3654249.1 lipocalin-like domain-containing protein [Metabacillus litoralis]